MGRIPHWQYYLFLSEDTYGLPRFTNSLRAAKSMYSTSITLSVFIIWIFSIQRNFPSLFICSPWGTVHIGGGGHVDDFFLLFTSFQNNDLASQHLPRVNSEVLFLCFGHCYCWRMRILFLLMLKFPHLWSVDVSSSWHPNSFHIIISFLFAFCFCHKEIFKAHLTYFPFQNWSRLFFQGALLLYAGVVC